MPLPPDEDPVDTPDQTGPDSATPTPRWFQRVLPTSVLGVLVLVLATLLVPGVRQQVSLSTSHRPEPYVELYFARPSSGHHVACVRRGKTVKVGFVIASHLERRQTIAYRATVRRSGHGSRVLHNAGATRVTPGTTRTVRPTFALRPGHAYTVTVRLPALHQQLRARCPAVS
jgi:hypothetical protein